MFFLYGGCRCVMCTLPSLKQTPIVVGNHVDLGIDTTTKTNVLFDVVLLCSALPATCLGNEVTTGGRALRYASSMRAEVPLG